MASIAQSQSSGAASSQSASQSVAPTLLSLRDGRLEVEAANGLETSTAYRDVKTFDSSGPSVGPSAAGKTTTTTADFDTFSQSELRGAIVSIMQSKDEASASLEETRARLAEAGQQIECLRSETAAGRQTAAKLEKKVAEAETNAENKSKFLLRENQLLKHQLKKYVGTVQSLQRQKSVVDDESGPETSTFGSSAIDAAAVGLDAMLDKLNENGAGVDFAATNGDDIDQVRKSYEQKLVQVSEMHSELMEFNDQLVMQVGFRKRNGGICCIDCVDLDIGRLSFVCIIFRNFFFL